MRCKHSCASARSPGCSGILAMALDTAAACCFPLAFCGAPVPHPTMQGRQYASWNTRYGISLRSRGVEASSPPEMSKQQVLPHFYFRGTWWRRRRTTRLLRQKAGRPTRRTQLSTRCARASPGLRCTTVCLILTQLHQVIEPMTNLKPYIRAEPVAWPAAPWALQSTDMKPAGCNHTNACPV